MLVTSTHELLIGWGYKLVDDAWSSNGRLTYDHNAVAAREFIAGLAKVLRTAGWETHPNIVRAFRHPIISDELIEIEPGVLGMSIADATKKLLAAKRVPLKNPDIATLFKAGGLVLNSKDRVNTIGAVFSRRAETIGDIVKVERGTWGLKEWYPNRSFKKEKESAKPDSAKGTEEAPTKRPGAFHRERIQLDEAETNESEQPLSPKAPARQPQNQSYPHRRWIRRRQRQLFGNSTPQTKKPIVY